MIVTGNAEIHSVFHESVVNFSPHKILMTGGATTRLNGVMPDHDLPLESDYESIWSSFDSGGIALELSCPVSYQPSDDKRAGKEEIH